MQCFQPLVSTIIVANIEYCHLILVSHIFCEKFGENIYENPPPVKDFVINVLHFSRNLGTYGWSHTLTYKRDILQY